VAVKVLGRTGSGATSGVLRGIEWAVQTAQASGKPSIISMSLGSTTDGGKNAAVDAAVNAGVCVTVAAGNSNTDACGFYPASAPLAICAGSTMLDSVGEEQHDTRSSFSNYGTCVEIWAPGSSITSCGITSPTSSSIKSGTSMACPHVAGYAAILRGENPTFNPKQILDRMRIDAQLDLLLDVEGSPNLLLFNPDCA